MVETPRKQVTVNELEQLFAEQKWEERLASCDKAEYKLKPTPIDRGYPRGTVTVGYKYKSREGRYIALVFYYKRPDGSSSNPRPRLNHASSQAIRPCNFLATAIEIRTSASAS